MFQALVSSAQRLLLDFQRALLRPPATSPQPPPTVAAPPTDYEPLERVLLTDGVGHTLFEEYAHHRVEARGDEETGWVLLGLREAREAIVLATLPAGAERDASVTHVRFNSTGQALGSRIVRQHGRRISMLGVVHTHPGSLRHPSDADFRGDSQWVQHLRGKEGIFGIGTADAQELSGGLFVEQPKPHVQCLGELRLSWYSLRFGDPGYRPLPVSVTIGPDLARPLHSVWMAIEAHADRLERLYRQQTGVAFDVLHVEGRAWLAVTFPLAAPGAALRVLLQPKEVRYFLRQNSDWLAVDCLEDRVDRGVYLLLAELAGQD
jgi:proteasome lid subunit RPN8/RPN11